MARFVSFLFAFLLPFMAVGETEDAPSNVFGSDTGRTGAARHDGAVRFEADAADRDAVQLFVEANVVETLYHELAHVLVDQLDLAVFGPEEFAADMFAVVLLNRMFDEPTAVRMAYDIAASYDHDALKAARSTEGHAMWDVHGLDRQRYFTFACLMFGANPTKRAQFAHRLGLPRPRLETCESEFRMTARAWGGVLDRLAEDAPGGSLELGLAFEPESVLTRFVVREIDRLNRAFVLPERVSVNVVPCSAVNAFYDTQSGEILICTELARHLAEIAPQR